MQSVESQNNSSDKWFSLNNKRAEAFSNAGSRLHRDRWMGGLQCKILFLERCWISGLQKSQLTVGTCGLNYTVSSKSNTRKKVSSMFFY